MLKEYLREFEKLQSEIKEQYNSIIEEILDKYSIELYGYPPDFEKKKKGKPVDLERLHKILIELSF